MIYHVDSDYQIHTGSHLLLVKRHDPRTDVMDVWVPTFRRVKIGEMYATGDECLFHPQEFKMLMQAFADEAWRVGIKPSNYNKGDNEKQLEAMQNHINDLRRLLFVPTPPQESKP